LKKKKIIWGIFSLIIISLILYWLLSGAGINTKGASIEVPVKKGPLTISVIVQGELQALNSEDIKGPIGMSQAGIYNTKIADLIPEGTVVKQGDLIATLDKSDILAKLKDASSDLNKIESQYIQTRLDTALDMRKLRDELINLKYDMEEKKLVMEQSKYEPPTVIRQAEIDMEKTKRAYKQAQTNYNLKLDQNRAKMQEISATLGKQQGKVQQMETILGQFTVTAPKAGMLIYKKDWGGRKIKVGSNINSWDPVVATLPDLSVMVSQTYVNEIDISKIKMGQPVDLSVDAFPGKKFKGHVTSIANVGEQLPNIQSKVFEVIVSIDSNDTTLRPSMTTTNVILTETLPPGTIYVPLDCVQGSDSFNYVYKDEHGRIIKQEVIVGNSNSENAEIKGGLNEGEMVYLSTPSNSDKLKVSRLSQDIKSRFRIKTDQPGIKTQMPQNLSGIKTGKVGNIISIKH
jgi:multidrug efflux pump subunit AcrA (membrane-fusion protein)